MTDCLPTATPAARLLPACLLAAVLGCGGGQPAAKLLREHWDASFIQDAKVGSTHTAVHELQEDGRRLIRTTVTQQLSLSRSDDVAQSSLKLVSVETPEGRVVRLESSISSGDTAIRSRGRVVDGALQLTQSAGGSSQQMTLDWDDDMRGFFAIEQSLAEKPLGPGESRELRSFMPAVNQVADVRLQAASQPALEETPDGAKLLQRVDARMEVDGTALRQTLWCDDSGEVLKSFDPQVKLTSYRTTRERATAPAATVFRFDDSVFVKAAGEPMESPHDKRRAVYRVRLQDLQPAEIFPSSGGQQVRRSGDREAVIEVHRPAGPPPPGAVVSSDEDLSPNTLIQSDDARVRQLASGVPAAGGDPWRLAVALEKLVHERVQRKDYSRAFDSAADVARKLQGDCTEHAVLLAALCRARQIPSRVASGLVAYRDGFAYHMWTEVWVNGSWAGLDATLGRGGIGAGHIKLVDSNLAGANTFSALLPVLQVIGRLEIEVMSAE